MADGCGVELVLDGDDAEAPVCPPAGGAPSASSEVPACACGKPSKYKCPGCGIRSCSLPCVKKHKVEHQCNGKRDAAAFCDIRSFDDKVLTRDYTLLESVGRTVESAERGHSQIAGGKQPTSARRPDDGLTPAQRELLRQAKWRGVELELLPRGMQRQRDNSSRYDHRRKRLTWRVEVHFPQAGVRHSVASVPEGCDLLRLLRSLLEADFSDLDPAPSATANEAPRQAEAAEPSSSQQRQPQQQQPQPQQPQQQQQQPQQRRRADAGQRALLQHKLRSYAQHGVSNLLVFLKAERRRADDPRFHQLALGEALGDHLVGKTVIEFPTLHVATREEAAAYPLLAQSAGE